GLGGGRRGPWRTAAGTAGAPEAGACGRRRPRAGSPARGRPKEGRGSPSRPGSASRGHEAGHVRRVARSAAAEVAGRALAEELGEPGLVLDLLVEDRQ